MLHKEFWGLMFLFFVGWIFLGSSGGDRIERGCQPIGWSGNVITSMSALAVPSQQVRIAGWFDKFEYGCQYMSWRMFYEDEYQAHLEQRKRAAAARESGATAEPAAEAAPASAGAEAAPATDAKPSDGQKAEGPQGAL